MEKREGGVRLDGWREFEFFTSDEVFILSYLSSDDDDEEL